MIRPAAIEDLVVIDGIYNQAIDHGFNTAHIKPLTRNERLKWYEEHTDHEYPVYVFERNGKILGYISLSPYRQGREALSEVAEISFYVNYDSHGQGIGSQLLQYCQEQAASLNKKIFFAIIIEGNESSIRLLEKFNFEKWGFLPSVINYRGERRGHIYMGKVLSEDLV